MKSLTSIKKAPIFLLALVLLYLVHRFWLLAVTDIREDDFVTMLLMRQDWSALFQELVIKDNQLILFSYIQKLFHIVFPLNDFWLRTPSVIYGAIGLISFNYLLNDLSDRYILNLALTFSLFFSSAFIDITTLARPYSLMFLLVITTTILLKKTLQNLNNKKTFNLLYLNVALVLLTHYIATLYVYALLITMFFVLPKRNRISRTFPVFLFAFLLTLLVQYQFHRNLSLISWNNDISDLENLWGYMLNLPSSHLISLTISLILISWSGLLYFKKKSLEPTFLITLLLGCSISLFSILFVKMASPRYLTVLSSFIFLQFGHFASQGKKQYLFIVLLTCSQLMILSYVNKFDKKLVFHREISELKEQVTANSKFSDLIPKKTLCLTHHAAMGGNNLISYYIPKLCDKFSLLNEVQINEPQKFDYVIWDEFDYKNPSSILSRTQFKKIDSISYFSIFKRKVSE